MWPSRKSAWAAAATGEVEKVAAEAEKGGDLRGGPVAAATPNAASFGPAALFFRPFRIGSFVS